MAEFPLSAGGLLHLGQPGRREVLHLADNACLLDGWRTRSGLGSFWGVYCLAACMASS